jgi:hypothetical protein
MCNCGNTASVAVAFVVMVPGENGTIREIVVDNESQARGAIAASGCLTCGWSRLTGDEAKRAKDQYLETLRAAGAPQK